MKQIRTQMALLLCAISLLPVLASHATAQDAARRHPERRNDPSERGDVPGWVMITLMSAVLVAALLALAGPALEALFNQAMDKVGQ